MTGLQILYSKNSLLSYIAHMCFSHHMESLLERQTLIVYTYTKAIIVQT